MKVLIGSIGIALVWAAPGVAGQSAGQAESRGELLYSTYCIGCHTTQVHWRDKRLATDWDSLKFQVNRWQRNVAPGLGEDDIASVARYLNGLYYHFPVSDSKRSEPADASRRVAARHD